MEDKARLELWGQLELRGEGEGIPHMPGDEQPP